MHTKGSTIYLKSCNTVILVTESQSVTCKAEKMHEPLTKQARYKFSVWPCIFRLLHLAYCIWCIWHIASSALGIFRLLHLSYCIWCTWHVASGALGMLRLVHLAYCVWCTRHVASLVHGMLHLVHLTLKAQYFEKWPFTFHTTHPANCLLS